MKKFTITFRIRDKKNEYIWARIVEAENRTAAEEIAKTFLNPKHGFIRILKIDES